MRDKDKNMPRRLSLILAISVTVLFFFYAVWQHTRGDGSELSVQTNIINSSLLAQYPAAVRTVVVPMTIGGTDVKKLRFNTPDEFGTLDSPETGVFHPQGGGVTYMFAPADVMADNEPGTWIFNAELSIADLGTDASELVGYLPGINEEICREINGVVGISGIPRLHRDQSALYRKRMVDDGMQDYVFPGDAPPLMAHEGLKGHAIGCFEAHKGGTYVFYFYLLER